MSRRADERKGPPEPKDMESVRPQKDGRTIATDAVRPAASKLPVVLFAMAWLGWLVFLLIMALSGRTGT